MADNNNPSLASTIHSIKLRFANLLDSLQSTYSPARPDVPPATATLSETLASIEKMATMARARVFAVSVRKDLTGDKSEAYLTQGAGAQHNMAFAMAKTPCKDVFAQSLACFQDSQAHDDDDTGECTELNIDMGMCIGTNAKEIQQSPYFEESVRRAAQARGEL